MIVAGLHLLATLSLVDSPRRSAVAVLDGAGRLEALTFAGGDDEVVAAVPADAAVVVVDAPLAVPDERGQRDVEKVLAWCDIPAFPSARARLTQVHGGMRGVALAPRLPAGAEVLEGLPDQVLRQLAWERAHPPGTPPLGLADYRAEWIGVRPPAYRARGGGRARPEGRAAAVDLLAGAIDLAGWTPHPAPDDWEALRDAAAIDALACACLALRWARDGAEAALVVGTPERGRMVLAAGPDLRARVAVNLRRLRAEGALAI